MSQPVSPMAIGSFLLGGIVLLISALLVFGGGQFFKTKLYWVVYFDSSLNGLNVGAPVKVQGVQVGMVKEIVLQMDMKKAHLTKPVVLEIEPGAMINPQGLPVQTGLTDEARHQRVKLLIESGLRARLETQSLLTGLLYVDLNFYPMYLPHLVGGNYKGYPEIPSIPTTADVVKSTLEEVVEKIKDLPLDKMVKDLSDTLSEIRSIVHSDETEKSRKALAHLLSEADKLAIELNRELPMLLQETRQTVKIAGKTAESTTRTVDEAGYVVKETGHLVKAVQTDIQPILRTAEISLHQATATLKEAQNTIANINDATASGVTIQETLESLRNASRSIEQLARSLEQKPESLLYGK